eukprot:361839-Chlamydomonas_euryale.AAC.17
MPPPLTCATTCKRQTNIKRPGTKQRSSGSEIRRTVCSTHVCTWSWVHLLARGDDLPQHALCHQLAGVARRHAADVLLALDAKLEQHAQQLAALRKTRLGPHFLGGLALLDDGTNLRAAHACRKGEGFTCGCSGGPSVSRTHG